MLPVIDCGAPEVLLNISKAGVFHKIEPFCSKSPLVPTVPLACKYEPVWLPLATTPVPKEFAPSVYHFTLLIVPAGVVPTIRVVFCQNDLLTLPAVGMGTGLVVGLPLAFSSAVVIR